MLLRSCKANNLVRHNTVDHTVLRMRLEIGETMNTNLPGTAIRVERPTKTLRELALDKVRDAIVDGYFKPGDRLVERDLCAKLGVSRTIVREVLRHLESEGLVATLPNKGPIVARLELKEAKQIYEIRAALEGMAARLCAEQRDPAIADALQASLEDIRKSYAAKDMPGVLSHTSAFYHTLFTKVERHVAWGVVNLLTVRINHLRSMTIKTKNRNVDAHDHVTNASSIAVAVLSAQQTGE